MVIAGLVILVPRFDLSDRITLGVCWGTFSGLTFAFIALINRHYVRRLSSRVIVLLQQSGAAVFALPAVMLSSVAPSLKDAGLLAVLGIVCTAFAQILYIRSLKMLKAQTAAVILCLEPLYGILLAWLIIREVPGWRPVIGGVLILFAVILVMRRPVSPLSGRSEKRPKWTKA
jgi:drug/metabolite transporter (DMT)-like permease